MKVKTNDKVKVISGKNKGKTGKVLRVFRDQERIVVEGVNVVKRHVKPGKISKEGGIINIEKPIHVSNVLVIDSKTSKEARVGYKIIEGKKYRINKSTGEVLEQ